jgi:predicted Zn finger-like uncharacterized protein
MSLITQCPACSTMFKVVPDQLRVSQGWVRCGQCDEVFDANAHMRNGEQETAYKPPAPPIHETLVTGPLATEPVSSQTPGNYDWGGVAGGDEASPQSESLNDAFLEKSPQELAEASTVDTHRESVSVTEEPLSVYPAYPSSNDYADSAPLSFMTSKPAGRLQTGRLRGLWITAFVLLSGAMLLQVVLRERDRLAAVQPSLKPVLVALCDALSCKLQAPMQIESIVIDSSAFSKVKPDVYKLSVTLKNTATVELVKPSLELTLTDAQDQALIRKVISPADLGDKVAVIGQNDEVSWTIPLSVKHTQGAEQIAGYRVVAFYP